MTDNCTKLPASTQVMIAVAHAYQHAYEEYLGEPPAHVIAAAAIRAATDQTRRQRIYCLVSDLEAIADKLDPLPTTGEHR